MKPAICGYCVYWDSKTFAYGWCKVGNVPSGRCVDGKIGLYPVRAAMEEGCEQGIRKENTPS